MSNSSTYHVDAARTGWFKGVKQGGGGLAAWKKIISINLGGAVRGAPLVMENWTLRGGPLSGQTHDIVIVTTSTNLLNAYTLRQLYAGDTRPLWSTQLPPASMRSGSNIPPPVGISSTPVLNESTGDLHVLALQSAGKLVSGETSPHSPALAAHNGHLFIAWKGDGNDQLNVAHVVLNGNRVVALANKVVLGDTSPVSPALASFNGRLYIAWKGDGNDNLNVMSSGDDGRTFGGKFTSPETSPEPPALVAHNGMLFIGWKGDGNDQLNIAQVVTAGSNVTGFANKVVLGDSSDKSPALASFAGKLFIAWKGSGNDNLNLMFSEDNGRTFGHKHISGETSPRAPALAILLNDLWISWKGDGNDQLNIAVVGFNGAAIAGFGSKLILDETSPESPTIAAFMGDLFIGWKGYGNDNLNVSGLPGYHVNVLDVNTGSIKSSTPLSDPGAAGRPTFNGAVLDQRGALNVAQGFVYATFADFLAFDKGDYHGWLVGWQANNPNIQTFVPTTKTIIGGGAWGPGGPAAGPDGSLYVATGNGGTDGNYWHSINGGGRLGNKATFGDTSPKAPALAVHNGMLFIAWKGDGNDQLNVAQVVVTGNRPTGLVNKVVLGDTSPVSPALASLNARLYLAWKGDGNDNLNVMSSGDNGHSFGGKFTSPETSPEPPALCAHNGRLFIAWKGDGNDQLNVAQVVTAAANVTGFANKVVLHDTSPKAPALASFNGRLYLAWKGDGNDNLNVMFSEDNGSTFKNKFISGDTSPEAPALCAHHNGLYLGWKGDGNDNLNVAQLFWFEGAVRGVDKVVLSDTSPASLALASFNGMLFVAWRGNGNDQLNVMRLASQGEIGDFQESVVRFNIDGRVAFVTDWYTPLDANVLDATDEDIGGSSPLVLPPIGGLEMVVVTGKDGRVYLLNRNDLGRLGGALWRSNVFGSESKCCASYFHTQAGDDLVYVIGGGKPGLAAFKVVVHSAAEAGLRPLWKAGSPEGINLGDFPGSSTTQSFPEGEAVVWIVDDTIPALRGFDAKTGKELFNSSVHGGGSLGGIAHFPPIACGSTNVLIGLANGFAVYGSPDALLVA
ncbi:hypothetical protein OGR47_15025 [Methylocystis sp. MJC1]|jgi:hypothetical protein|uniref:hypothetical protein n=1 Tax=Methylocystis sp. MJC1 TaxID=2654282 RepID=UPI0013EB7B15|nr:hypothetical protein [Methylocystis sp. MJC1]KAF2989014.1 hypothetical protein MJC1_03923 [Methylocystis sp. MJC1]MBU6528274.1 hypothetical protein [Methylocystis sp. MJC1]UZX11182.1 hypothetical protein OGR47_15025 [Methylocystis sp. MJC1]